MMTRYIPASWRSRCVCIFWRPRIQPMRLTSPMSSAGLMLRTAATVRADLHETAGFDVRFGGGTGRIRLLCPYHLHSKTFGRRIGITMMSLIDQDGMEAGRGSALFCAGRRWGTNIAIMIGARDSNTLSITSPPNIACFMPPY